MNNLTFLFPNIDHIEQGIRESGLTKSEILSRANNYFHKLENDPIGFTVIFDSVEYYSVRTGQMAEVSDYVSRVTGRFTLGTQKNIALETGHALNITDLKKHYYRLIEEVYS